MSSVISKPIKSYASNYGINLRKSSNKVPITIFQMLLAGKQTHKNKAFFMGSTVLGGFYGFVLWEVKMLWVWIMGVTLVIS
jgi:hypothetical protein